MEEVEEERWVVQTVTRVYTPPLCLFGAIGNCLSVYVFCMTSTHRNLSSSYYLSALAISDIGFLINLFVVWLSQEGVQLMNTRFSCPLVIYSGQVTCFLSVWFVVAFTAERFCAVCYPLTRPAVCTVARAKKVILAITLLALLGFSYVWVIADVVLETESGQDGPNATTTTPANRSTQGESGETWENRSVYVSCSVPARYQQISGIANHVDSFLTLILPFFIITFLNFRITLCVWKLKGQRETIVAVARLNSANSTRPALTESRSCLLRNGLALSTEPAAQAGGQAGGGGGGESVCVELTGPPAPARLSHHSSAAEVRVTKTLLLVSSVFLVLNLPSHAIRAFTFIHTELWGSDLDLDTTMAAQMWANILFNTNFSVNFLLYCVSGRNFRKSLRSLCWWDRVRDRGRRARFLSKPTTKTQSTKRRTSSHRRTSRRNRQDTLGTHPSARPTPHPALSPNTLNREMSFYPSSLTEVETYA